MWVEYNTMTSQNRGKITVWKEDKGYGFITPDEGGNDVFVHASSLPSGLKRPPQNAAVSYSLGHDIQKRPRAINIRFDRDPVTMTVFPAILVGLFFIGLAAATLATKTLPIPFAVYAIVSGITFVVYGADKAIAVRNEQVAPNVAKEQRVPEAALHLLELLGGWPGALVAQWYHRHKNRKPAYQTAYWLTVILNLAILAGYLAINMMLR
jgi:uncharacterized membrane protein YsdA (DUF1294 family)/cold shock CspA family protein